MKTIGIFTLNGAVANLPLQELSGFKGARYRFHWVPRDLTNQRVGKFILDARQFDLTDPEDVARFNFIQRDLIGTHQRFPFPIAEIMVIEDEPSPAKNEPDAPDVQKPVVTMPPEEPDTVTALLPPPPGPKPAKVAARRLIAAAP